MKLYNSLSQKIENFAPLYNDEVKMYVCGITPYDTTHLGHAFTYIFYDTLYKYLQHKGYKVTYVQNVTDIDDDILKRAKEKDKNWKELGDYWTKKFLHDCKTLNIAMPTHYVKATDSIQQIIAIAKNLQGKGYAYTREGNVYFETKKDKEYSKLSRYSRSQMLLLSRERGANPGDRLKKDPLDFILWQRSLPDEPFWESPWGKGRPGWHIECSAMNYRYLGKQIDVHGGGHDLIYPHHESEIAQSECFTEKKPFAKYWLHTGAVMYQGEKMSKSLGNLVMVSDLLKKYSAGSIRLALLSHHYRMPWEFAESELEETEKTIKILKTALRIKSTKNKTGKKDYLMEFDSVLQNDMNIPEAVNIMISCAKRYLVNPSLQSQNSLKKMTRVLGLGQEAF